MDEQSRREAEGIRKLPISLLEYLPKHRWQRTLAALILLIILSLVFFGQMMNMQIRYARLKSELSRYESLWQSQQISNYEYALSASSYEGYSEVAVRAQDGTPISEGLEHPFTGEIYKVPIDIGSLDTIPELFSRIRKALADKEENGVSRLVIRYSKDLGYPTHIELRSQPEGQLLLIQGDYAYTIYDFKILEPKPVRYARLKAELDKYVDLWQNKEISSYEYTLKASIREGYSQLSIRVEGSTAASEEIVKSGSLAIDSFDTVPDLFNVIREALIAREENGFNELDIQYNEDTGHPTYIALRDSHKLGDPGIYSYSIIDFKILEQE